jgi:hypothetical protein
MYLSKESAMARYQFKHAAKYAIVQEDELNYQLVKINLKPDDVNLVVLHIFIWTKTRGRAR